VILAKEYPQGTKTTVFASQGFAVSGKPGWLIAFTPRFKPPGVKATHDTDVAVAVATDPSNPHVAPGLFFVSIPSDVNSCCPTSRSNSTRSRSRPPSRDLAGDRLGSSGDTAQRATLP
jgi:hypothetical protein